MITNSRFNYLLLLVLPVLLVSCSSGEDSNGNDPNTNPAPVPAPVPDKTIQSLITYTNPGKVIDVFYYDIKQTNRNVTSAAMANEIFVVDDANGMRIPIFGTDAVPAHPSEGVVVDNLYTDMIKAINFAKQARGTKEFKIFASKKLEAKTSFPAWVKDADGIIPSKYAILLADFLVFMKSKNIKVDYLGIDNEFIYNEGNLTPQKYSQTIDFLKTQLINKGIDMPILIGYEDYGPNKQNWLKTLINNGWGDKMDIYGTHYYPHLRPKDKLIADLALIGTKPFWSTEPHWDNDPAVNDFDEAEQGMLALWDQIDLGMSGFMWWNYELNSLRGKLMRAASVPLLGSKPIKITDIDGEDITALGKLQTRAFIEGKTITVFAVNMSNTVLNNYTFKIDGTSILGKISSLQWTETSAIDGVSLLINSEGDSSNIFSLTLPQRSITRFTFEIK